MNYSDTTEIVNYESLTISNPVIETQTRSSRSKLHPRKLMDFFFIFCYSLVVDKSQYHEVVPVIWRKSKNIVVTGTPNEELTVRYISPWSVFDRFKIIKLIRKTQMKSWFENFFKENFIDIVNRFCSRHYHLSIPNSIIK